MVRCYFINEKILGFPVLFQGLTREEFRSVRVYLKKFGGESVDITENGVSIESTGIYLDAGKYIQNNSSYEIRAEYKDGYITIPDKPGLGIEINEEECLNHPYQPHTLRHYTGALTDIRPAKTEFYF